MADDNQSIVDGLLADHRSGIQAEIELRYAGKNDEADQVWLRTQTLMVKIDTLVGRMMDNWGVAAAGATTALAAAQVNIGAAVENIQKNMDIANQVISILGALDSVLSIAAKLLP